METNTVQLKNILEIVKYFDDARWEHINNRKINHESFFKGVSENGKILTHWLRYITNRNMNADKLWEKASSCLSEIVFKIENNSYNAAESDRIKKYLGIEFDNSSFRYIEKDKEGKVINNYRFVYVKDEKEELFSSRYYPSDYYSIISTFEILRHKDFNFSIGNYLNTIYKHIKDNNENIVVQKIVFTLYLLTYYYNPQLNKEDIENNLEDFNIFKMAKERAKIVIEVIQHKDIFNYSFAKFIGDNNVKEPNIYVDFIKRTESSFNKLYKWQQLQALLRDKRKEKKDITYQEFNIPFFKEDYKNSNAYKQLFTKNEKLFEEKRIWCSFRDFLKNDEFKNIFKTNISQLNDLLFENDEAKDSILKCFELPGDLWNNRNVFWECLDFLESRKKNDIYEKYIFDDNKSIKPAKILRDTIDQYYCQNDDQKVFYPEQFDFTFDFVSRMCESNNCDICPFGKLLYKEKGTNLNMLCIENKEKYCPIVSTACNYKFKCKGECKVSEILVNEHKII
jgi:hypothetical protein